MGATSRGLDPKTMARLKASREAAAKNLEAAKEHGTDDEHEPSPEELFLTGKETHTVPENRVLFSDLFWKPKSVPDFPVPKYEAEYWDESIRERIPEPDNSYYLDRNTVEQIAYSMFAGGTTLLHGPTGTGKTSILQEIAARCGIPFLRVSCHGQMEVSEFLGANSVVNDGGVPITKHSDTDTTLACKWGGLLCLDEVFRTPSPALMSIQATLEYPHALNLQDSHGNARQIRVPQEDFWLMLTDNTTGVGDTTGNFTAEVQDTSTRNRIRRAIYVDYLPEKQEVKLVAGVYPDIPESFIRNMVKTANLIRDAFKTNSCMETMSIRELLTWCKDFKNTRSMELGFKMGVYSKLTPDDKTVMADIYSQVFGKKLR